MLERYFAAHPLTDVRYVPQFPPITDRVAWDKVDPADRDDLLALAEAWRNKPYPMLTAGMFASYIRTGSRRDCEGPYFARRRKLCAAALHVCLTGTDAFLPDVEDGLWLLCEETAWAISAHAGLNGAHPFPDDRRTIVDLFAAQTGMILSFIVQLLADRLHPDIADRVRREVERRILHPFMENDGEWWMGFVRKDLNNWTPWIVSNVLMAANVWHYGGAALVERACGMLDRWLDCVPADGGCDEGAGYWNMAGGAFLDCLALLETMADVNLWANEKVRRMMAYPELVYLGSGWFANFADCDARPYISGERLQYAGEKTGNSALVRMGVEMRREPSYELSDTPHLSRLLMRLFSKPAKVGAAEIKPIEVGQEARLATGFACKDGCVASTRPCAEGWPKDVWLPDLQVRILEGHDLIKGIDWRLMVAMKGGHNAESHNHNDVGSFLVATAFNDEPLGMQIVDAGNMVYTAKTFSDRRYELWNCRSVYHNVPIIGGYEQCNGVEYAAKEVKCLPNGMALDMAAAYPKEASVQTCRREMHLVKDHLTIRDEIVLDEEKPVTWVFMLRQKPVIERDEGLFGEDHNLCLCWADNEEKDLTWQVEEIEITDARMAKSYPGSLWRLTLAAPPKCRHNVEFWIEP